MLGLIHNLSKRTALYIDASQVDNKGVGSFRRKRRHQAGLGRRQIHRYRSRYSPHVLGHALSAMKAAAALRPAAFLLLSQSRICDAKAASFRRYC